MGTDVFEFKKQATHLIRALSDNEGFLCCDKRKSNFGGVLSRSTWHNYGF